MYCLLRARGQELPTESAKIVCGTISKMEEPSFGLLMAGEDSAFWRRYRVAESPG